MTAYELPTSLNISGVDFSIRTDFRVIIDILVAMNDPELDEQAKAVVMLQILFEDWQSIPPEHLTEACQKACEFIDCGQVDDSPNKPKPRLMDWEQDGDMIVPAVNKVAGKEIRAVPYMHWWTFLDISWNLASVCSTRLLESGQKKQRVKNSINGKRNSIRKTRILLT